MDKNHDMMKAESLTKIRKSSGKVLIFAIVLLIIELVSKPCLLLYTILMTRKLAESSDSNFLDYLIARRFGTVPEQIIRAVLMIAAIVILIVLFVRIRKSESPFQEKHGILLQIVAVLLGIIPFEPIIEDIVCEVFYKNFAIKNVLILFDPTFFSYWLLASAVILFVFGRVIRYGAVLQQESDETL